MKLFILLAFLVSLFLLVTLGPVLAHQSGCHRWHSCPSDHATYICGDIGYCSQCGNNYYCKAGVYKPNWQKLEADVKKKAQAAQKKLK